MLAEEIKKQIDDMDYISMLSLWRFAPSGSLMFQGETGTYFAKIMKEKESTLSHEERVNVSKSIGW